MTLFYDVSGARALPGRASSGEGRSLVQGFLRRRLALAAAVYIGAIMVVAVLANQLAPYNPAHPFPGSSYQPPSVQHWLGTDDLGRDILSRLVFGARVSLAIGVFAPALALLIGSAVGLVAGYRGGFTGAVLMRLTDAFYAFPTLLLVVLLAAAFGSSASVLSDLLVILVAIVVGTWTDFARLMHAQVTSLKDREVMVAARSLGASPARILFHHLLPAAAGPLLVRAAYGVPTAILLEAVLSFIGLGVKPPTPSWGSMIQTGSEALLSAPYVVIFPSLTLTLTMLAFNILGDGLRDTLDPQTR